MVSQITPPHDLGMELTLDLEGILNSMDALEPHPCYAMAQSEAIRKRCQ
jgi:hypothetical protein